MTVRLSNRISQWMSAAIKELATGVVIWDYTFQALPDPGTNGYIPMLVLYMEIPSVKPGDSIYVAPILPIFGLTAEQIHASVKETLDLLLAKRGELVEDSANA